MIYTYEELVAKFGNQRKVKNAVANEELFQLARGYYSELPGISNDYVVKRYPQAVLTGRSAYYHYGLSDVIPEIIEVACPLGTTRILDKSIKQSFQIEPFYGVGKSTSEGLPIYDQERMLIELFRFKKKYPYEYYKEVLDSFRQRSDKMDFFKVSNYLNRMGFNARILEEIREAF
jgi:hypothetical protein